LLPKFKNKNCNEGKRRSYQEYSETGKRNGFLIIVIIYYFLYNKYYEIIKIIELNIIMIIKMLFGSNQRRRIGIVSENFKCYCHWY
jgi:hypothetical protein